ncbi:DEAD/DEAH box helicase [Nisaea acidiphila]|uniref:DEAD-box ATP-dependent RNA helicase RhpA n=1 Tax=Nisaea acidiphila TaxID=1862145 RepID=A0A9J7AU59_9PROT|nr:DEAD/DEAH box helicase [Nisaea acidiphila]UUX50638.1 DEAD/DEAH box helicase [Nisaea acidiphila]
MTCKTFSELALCEPLLRSLQDAGFETPTPIQQQSIPLVLDRRDLLAIAQTGTGKTAAFSLPILQHLWESDKDGRRRLPAKTVRVLILAPTRELAVQIGENIATFTRHLKMKQVVIVGGVSFGPQRAALGRGADVLVATPGRLLDLVQQNAVILDAVSHLVLDEADRMLDMGFVHDVRKIARLVPEARQTLLFSATMPPKVEQLAQFLLDEPARVEVTPEVVTVDRIKQTVHHVEAPAKKNLLLQVMSDPDYAKVIIFTRTKHKADRISKMLTASGIESEALHGNKTQSARQRALGRFKQGAVRALVATDIAARGIDVSDISHVINFELPNEPESYVHRIGRTARAGTDGSALSLCAPDEFAYLKDIERLIGQRIEVVGGTAPEGSAANDGGQPKNGRGNGARKSRGRKRNGKPFAKGPSDKPPQQQQRAPKGKPQNNKTRPQKPAAGGDGKLRRKSRDRREAA